MRVLMFAAILAALSAQGALAQAPAKPAPRPAPQAPSAMAHATPASARAPALGKGYAARDRHMADCLASAPGYDPRIDRVRLRSGATRPCSL